MIPSNHTAGDADPSRTTRQALQEATAPLHGDVEARFAGLDLARPADYARFLLAHAEVIPALETALERFGIATLLPDWPRRHRRGALAEDLVALGCGLPIPRPFEVSAGSEALGVAYVLEGSRLGAAMLLKTIPAGLPTAFLRHGQRDRLFPSFLPHLDAVDDVPSAIAGARRAFGLFLPGPAA